MTKTLNVTPKELAKWIANDEVVIVDVRETVEYNQHHLKKATNLPLSEVRLDHTHMPDHTGKKLVFHCKSGRRSQMACDKIMAEGTEVNVWNLEGGIDRWMAENFDVEVSTSKVIPLQRQVLLAAGLVVLTGVLLGFNVNPNWFLLSGFASLGLIFAGLTGWCGMAMLLAKMPWNK